MSFITDDFLLHNKTARALYKTYASRSRSWIITAICRPRMWPQIAASPTSSRSGSKAITTNGAPCARTASRNVTAQAMPRLRQVPRLGRDGAGACAIRSITGRISNCGATSGSTSCLDEKSAPAIWKTANEQLQSGRADAHGILRKFDVRAVCTTDDPAEPLDHHAAIAASGIGTKVYPTFRPDRALQVDDPATFNAWVDRLGSTAGIAVDTFAGFELARAAAAPGLPRCRWTPVRSRPGALLCRRVHGGRAAEIFDRARTGQAATASEHEMFASY